MRLRSLNCTFCKNTFIVRTLPGLHLPLLSCGHAICRTCEKMNFKDRCTVCQIFPKTEKQSDPEQGLCNARRNVSNEVTEPTCIKSDDLPQFKHNRKLIKSEEKDKRKKTSFPNEFKKPKMDCRTFRHTRRWKSGHKLVRQNAFHGSWPILV